MSYTFQWSDTGIEFKAQLEPKEKCTLYSLKMTTCDFKASGIRIAGDRLYEVMIFDIMLGKTSLTTTPFSLSVVQSFKSYVDGRIAGQIILKGDCLSFKLENRGNFKLNVTISIDGAKFPVRKLVTK